MQNQYIYLIMLICMIGLLFLYYKNNIIESFVNDETVILLGDSILKNNIYVSHENSIEQQLKQHRSEVICEAQDGAIISDVYYQMEQMPDSLNKNSVKIYISVGGNDIINYFIYSNVESSNFYKLHDIFIKYRILIENLKSKFKECKIVLIDLYYPVSNTYKEYYPLIKDWNDKLKNYANSNNLQLVEISKEISSPEDFINDIEPSIIGGEKIVNLLLTK
jgi:hypothetical protein